MSYKKVLGLGLMMVANTVFANGLTLQSSGISSDIKAICNGNSLPVEMKPNTSTQNLDWNLVSLFLGDSAKCTFVLDDSSNTVIGDAQLNINAGSDQGEVIILDVKDPSYQVSVSPVQDAFEDSLNVSLAKK